MENYSIGEVSGRLGLSRDTIRFYEKKGMIHPVKLENGYRSYTYEDVRKLLSIMFYRRLNFSLEDINCILYKSSFHSYCSMIQEKITEEKHQLIQHRQSLIHLKHLQQLYQDVEQYLNNYDIRPLQPYYQMANNCLINKMSISDLCYIYQEYQVKEQSAIQTEEYFMLSADTAAIMNMEHLLKDCPTIQHERCVYTIIESNSPIPQPHAIVNAANWAKEQGYCLSGMAYSGYLLSCAFSDKTNKNEKTNGDEPIYYIELYLPIKNQNLTS